MSLQSVLEGTVVVVLEVALQEFKGITCFAAVPGVLPPKPHGWVGAEHIERVFRR